MPGTRGAASLALSRRLAAVDRLQRALETALDEDGLQAALQRFLASFALGGEALALEVGLLDPAGRELRVIAGVGNERENGSVLDARGGLCGRVVNERSWVIAPAVELDPATPARLRGALAIGFALDWTGVPRGLLSAWIHPGRTSPDDTVEAMRLAALCLSLLLQQAEGRAVERHRAARFELISQVARLIGSDTDLDALLQRAADAIHTTLGFPAVDIPIIEADAPDCLTIRIRGGQYKRAIHQVDRIPLGRGIMGSAVRERRTQCVNDVARDPRYIKPPNVEPPKAELAVPILLDDAVLGVINVESPREFGALNVTSLELVAEFLAVAMRDARLFAGSQEAAVLQERQRIARELHDNISQMLSAIHMLVDTLEGAWRADPEKGAARTQRLRQLTQGALADMRALLRELTPLERPPGPQSLPGRSLAGSEAVRREPLPEVIARWLRTLVPDGIAVDSDFSGYLAQRYEHELALVRIVQEAVSNTVRHGRARRLALRAAVDGSHAMLEIRDDGIGLPPGVREGVGFSSMRARAAECGGELQLGAGTSGRGVHLRVRLPRMDRSA